ncbi:MAG: CaiB/BaiF CoA-transferase family protein, partial [Pseudomonadota bacterium]
VNRNKRSLSIDFTTDKGAEIIRELAKTADVFVENYRPGALDRSGLGYSDLTKLNPKLIYCSISGFGRDGPYRDRGGFDLIAQAMSGIISLTGERKGAEPVVAGVPLSDLNAGLFGALAVVAALNARARTGRGQHVESTLLESAMAYTVWETGLFFTEGIIAEPAGSRHRLAAPYEALKASDGYVVVGVNNERLWDRFCLALEAPQLAEDARFASSMARLMNRDALKAILEEILEEHTVSTWIDRLTDKGVPCGPINTVSDATEDPQIKHRKFFVDVNGRQFARAPVRFSETPVSIRRGPADLGGDTHAVLKAAGYSDDEIANLEADNVIRRA